MTDWSPAVRFYDAVRRAAGRTGFAEHIPQLLIRFGFPGFMTRIGVEPPVEADAALVRAQALHHTLLRERAEELARALEHAGIPHVFAKGITLMGPVYRPGDRLLADIDLYVPRVEVASASRVLADLGFAPLPDDEQAGPPAMRSTLAFTRPGTTEMDTATVDLHWALDPVTRLLPRPDHELPGDIFDQAEMWCGLRVPAPEHHAAILAHHVVDTDLLHVRSLVDLAFVFRSFAEDGGVEYRTLCEKLGVGRVGTLLAHLVRDDLGVARPGATGGRPKGWNAFTRGLTLEEWLVIVAQSPPDADDAITTARIRRRMRLVSGAALSLLMDALFPPRAFLAWRWQPRSVAWARWHHLRRVFGKMRGGSPEPGEGDEPT